MAKVDRFRGGIERHSLLLVSSLAYIGEITFNGTPPLHRAICIEADFGRKHAISAYAPTNSWLVHSQENKPMPKWLCLSCNELVISTPIYPKP